ncbi:MAG TPA: CpsB/CapC family capsule biosynthesis tyrosine phosphatase [Cytophagaceae bacterium]
MNLFSRLFSRQEKVAEVPPLLVDMHSHLLPGLDDGADTLEDTLRLIEEFVSAGYKKIITTPHIMGDFYKNTPEGIRAKLEEVRKALRESNINVELEAAAEYYLDEWFMAKLDNGEELLTFGNKYLLFETSYINASAHLHEAIFKIKTSGYVPVLAHPERYTYLYNSFQAYKDIYEKGVLFQLNLNSLSGYYSKAAQKIACQLIDHGMVDFVGTDCHGVRHIEAMKKSRATKSYIQLLQLNLKNNSLL